MCLGSGRCGGPEASAAGGQGEDPIPGEAAELHGPALETGPGDQPQRDGALPAVLQHDVGEGGEVRSVLAEHELAQLQQHLRLAIHLWQHPIKVLPFVGSHNTDQEEERRPDLCEHKA